MPRQISSKAMFVNCSDRTKQNLCDRWQLAEDGVSSIHRLAEFDQQHETANFDYVLIDRQTCASASREDLLIIQKLSGLSDCVIIADSQAFKNGFSAHRERSEEFEELISLIDHECRNVLQRIQMRIELIKTNTSDQDLLIQNLQRIEQANESLRQLMSTMSFLREPLPIDRTQHLLGDLIHAGWHTVMLDQPQPLPVETEFDLESQTNLWLDAEKIKLAIRDIFAFLISMMEGHEKIRVIDHSITIDGDRFHRVVFQVLPRSTAGHRNPQFQLAACKKILHEHGGSLEWNATTHENTACTITLPLDAT